MAKKETQLAKPRELEQWEKDLQDKAAKARSVETLGIPMLKHKGGNLSIDGKPLKDNAAVVIPLAVVYGKQFYLNAYSPGSKDTPDCYAFSADSDKGMVPHPAAPNKQAEACDTCPHNAFGTAMQGAGKRCSDVRKVPLILASDLEKQGAKSVDAAVAKAQPYQISIPAGSLRAFGQYLSSLKDTTPNGFFPESVSRITTGPGKNAYTVLFEHLEVTPREAMGALMKKAEPMFGELSKPYPVVKAEEPQKPIKGQNFQKGRR